MDWNLLSDVNSEVLAAALRGAAARHAALADNLANIDTPGFSRTDVPFEQALTVALGAARRAPDRAARLLAALPLRPRVDPSAVPRPDGNTVSIDREMAALARNSLRYHAASEALAARIRMLRAAIHGARR